MCTPQIMSCRTELESPQARRVEKTTQTPSEVQQSGTMLNHLVESSRWREDRQCAASITPGLGAMEIGGNVQHLAFRPAPPVRRVVPVLASAIEGKAIVTAVEHSTSSQADGSAQAQ